MNQTIADIEAVLSVLWPGVVAQQNGYYASALCYYQMLWTHKSVPAIASRPDNLDARPTDQPAAPMQGLPQNMRSRMRIDTYGKPDGWVMTLETVIDGVTWTKCMDCGVDASRTKSWLVVDAVS
jgi:hypothetical protein